MSDKDANPPPSSAVDGLIADFLAAATSDIKRAAALLRDHPELAGAGFHTALVLGRADIVDQYLNDHPGEVNTRSGPQNAEPLVYACFSRFGRRGGRFADAVVDTVRVLLRHGADPSTTFQDADGPLSCLYAASGVLNNPDMTRVLLAAGANTDDNESLYHATENRDLDCLKLLLQAGAKPTNTNALKHMVDWESPEGVRLLLAAGADPNETGPQGDTALHWAVRRKRNPEIITQLLDAGAQIDARRADGQTAHAMAVITDQPAVLELLAGRGADTQMDPLSAFFAGQGDLPKEFAASPAAGHLLTQLAENGSQTSVEALLQAGVAINARGGMGETALHWACWKGDVALMRMLLDHGAPLDAKESTYGAVPSGWLHHGATNCGEGDYAEGTRILLAAGVRDWNEPSGNPAMDAVLREAGLIA